MFNSLDDKKVEISYPTKWEYRIIGHKKSEIETIVTELLPKSDYTLENSRASKAGKYVSMVLKVRVENEKERLGLYSKLKENNSIVMVL